MVFEMAQAEERRKFVKSCLSTCLTTCLTVGITGVSYVGFSKSTARGSLGWDSASFRTQFPAMGSLLVIAWEDEGGSRTEAFDRAKRIDQQAREIAEYWNSILSDYDDNSESSRLASAADDLKWHDVSRDFGSVLNEVNDWHQLSMGAFDASLGAMTRLRRRPRLPSQEVWEVAKEQIGWHLVEWDRNRSRLRFMRSGVRFDFGAIGKGWVADRIFDLLGSVGINRCLINFAGNMRIGLPPTGKAGWPVSIDTISDGDERRKPEELIRLSLSECGISTSGDRWQRLPDASSDSRTTKTSHVMDPRLGRGIASPQSITIIAKDATRADAASTATGVHMNRNRSRWFDRLLTNSTEFRWIIQAVEEGEIHFLQQL